MPEKTDKPDEKPVAQEPSDFEIRMLDAIRRMATDEELMAEVAKKTS